MKQLPNRIKQILNIKSWKKMWGTKTIDRKKETGDLFEKEREET